MHSEPIQPTDFPAATQDAQIDESAATTPHPPTPIGLFNLGVAWLFGLEALLTEREKR